MLDDFFNKFFKFTQKIFEVLAVYNLIAAVLDLFFGYYDWMIMSVGCALLSYFLSKININVNIKK